VLYHATHSSVANSTSSTPFQGPRRWISSVLHVAHRRPARPAADALQSRRSHPAGTPDVRSRTRSLGRDLLGCRQAVLAVPLVTVGLAHPVPDALGRRLELSSELLGRPLCGPARRCAPGTPVGTPDGSSASWMLLSAPTMGYPRNRVNSRSAGLRANITKACTSVRIQRA